MNMKEHILAALHEQFERWENLLESLSEEQVTTPNFDHDWSIKDVLAHLWGWQQISISRMQAAAHGHEPILPQWVTDMHDWEEDANRTNAEIYRLNHTKSWIEIHKNWRDGFLLLLQTSEPISEREMLDGDRFPWLKGYSPAMVLVSSYEHHQEHIEKLTNWIKAHPTESPRQ